MDVVISLKILNSKFASPIVALLILIFGAGAATLSADDSQTKWSQTGALLNGRTCHTATLLPNGQVLIAGGHGTSDDLASVELFDPRNGAFTHATDMPTGRADHTATLLPTGQVLIVGGQSNGRTLASAVLYNPTTGTWTPTGNLHIARAYHTATLLQNGEVLVVGGVRQASPPVFSQGAPFGSALDIVELYDPATGKWSVTDNLHAARFVHTATLLKNGQVLVTGGMGEANNASVLSSAELYNPAEKSWTTTDNLRDARFWHTATLLSNGKVLVVAGQDNGRDLSSAELYDPSSRMWSSTGSLPSATSGHTASLLPTGQVVITGGALPPGVITHVEMYNPSTGTWERTGDMNTARSLHTATLLPGGQILVTGGSNGNGSPSGVINSAELGEIKAENIPENISSPILSTIAHPASIASAATTSHLLTLTSCLVTFTVCMVILTGCVVILLSVWLVFVLVRRWDK